MLGILLSLRRVTQKTYVANAADKLIFHVVLGKFFLDARQVVDPVARGTRDNVTSAVALETIPIMVVSWLKQTI